jgi:hypothetical protein
MIGIMEKKKKNTHHLSPQKKKFSSKFTGTKETTNHILLTVLHKGFHRSESLENLTSIYIMGAENVILNKEKAYFRLIFIISLFIPAA